MSEGARRYFPVSWEELHRDARALSWRLAERGFRRWGFVALVVIAGIPNPVFDALGILAGSLRYPIGRFWLATAAGKILKFLSITYLGWFFSIWMLVK